jgi:surfeit locus 1 family protein
MKRVPIVATLLVALAVAAMVGLGVWQLQRLHEKEALLARLSANQSLPPIALPRFYDQTNLYRRASAMCLRPAAYQHEGGHDASGRPGWRIIAQCATGAEGPGFAVQLGVAHDPNTTPSWRGGLVSGTIASAPGHAPLIAGLFGKGAPPEQMIVADTPLAGLSPNAKPDLSAIPNNHFAYAVQWFLFAAVALVIYAIALRRRLKAPPERRVS